jgi:methylated-DNA-[protein]-cysteine S-methyltransferase
MKNAFFYETSIGKVFIAEDENGITDLDLSEEVSDTSEFVIRETEGIKVAAKQLTEYLEGKRREFNLTLNPKGTQFQKLVWEALRKIPYGETRSYKEVAEAVGNPKASRAVGMANHNNPIMCIIPCHRVIGANGSLVGYAGGIKIKEQLLNLEKETERNVGK